MLLLIIVAPRTWYFSDTPEDFARRTPNASASR